MVERISRVESRRDETADSRREREGKVWGRGEEGLDWHNRSSGGRGVANPNLDRGEEDLGLGVFGGVKRAQ